MAGAIPTTPRVKSTTQRSRPEHSKKLRAGCGRAVPGPSPPGSSPPRGAERILSKMQFSRFGTSNRFAMIEQS